MAANLRLTTRGRAEDSFAAVRNSGNEASPTTIPRGCRSKGLLALGLEACSLPAPGVGRAPAAERSEHSDAGLAAAFPEYHFLRVISRGGSGVVYYTEHRVFRRLAALKLLSGFSSARVELAARFEREIHMLGRLDHPGIVRAFDAGRREGYWFLAMEFLDGVDFGGLARLAEPVREADACELVRQAALALQHAHECGLVHRDIKPGNLMLARGSGGGVRVKVLDFGLGSLAHGEGVGGDLTRSGEFLGTVDYVAPEQIENPRDVDARADVYGLGATLYRLLSGATPHQHADDETTFYARLMRVAQQPAVPLGARRPDLSPALASVVDRMVAQAPADRFQTAGEAALALDRFARRANLEALLARTPARTGSALEVPFRKEPVVDRPRRGSGRGFTALRWAACGLLGLAVGVAVWNLPIHRARVDPPAGAIGASVGVEPGPPPVARTPPGRDLSRLGLAADTAPRLLSEEWDFARDFRLGSPRGTRYHPVTEDLYYCCGRDTVNGIAWVDCTNKCRPIITNISAYLPAVAPDGETVVWGDQQAGVLGRARISTATVLPPLAYTGAVGAGSPMGICFPPAGWRGEPRFKGGGVLVDSGPGDSRGLWAFDLESGLARKLASPGPEVRELVDVCFSASDIYVLNRDPLGEPGSAGGPSDDCRLRLWRLAGDRLVPCRTDRPLADPCGLTWDPLTGDLYVVCGHYGRIPWRSRGVFRLRPTTPDAFAVTQILDHLDWPSDAGVEISRDGSRMIVTEKIPDQMVMIWEFRRAAPSGQTVAGLARP